MINTKRNLFVGLYSVSLIFMFTNLCPAQRSDTAINERWRFFRDDVTGGQNVSCDDSGWDTVDLPHTYNAFDTIDGGSYYRGPAWYRKSVSIDSSDSGKRIYLFFEAVGKAADVYCNEIYIGNHKGAYAAFCFDITDAVVFGADNLIAVRTDNSGTDTLDIIPRSGDFNQYGGICRTLRIIKTEPVHITLLDYASPGVYLKQTDVSDASAGLEVKVKVRNTETSAQSVTVAAKIYDAADTLVDTLQTTADIPADTTTDVIQNTTVADPHLWNGLADPYLYKVITEIKVNGEVVDSLAQPLGFRYFSVDPDEGFFLNGQYLDLHGVAMHEDRTGKGRAISDADRRQDVELMLEMGCNWIRPSHYQHAELFYDLCDEAGIVLSTEIPIVNGISFDTAFVENCEGQLKELIRQNYNHPSICFWLLYNELTTTGSETVIRRLDDLAHNEDPTRLTTCAHNNTSDTAAWSYVTDILAYNRYMGWYGGTPEEFAPWVDSIHSSRSGDAVGIMEYGAGANCFQHETPPEYPGPSEPFHPEEYQSYYHEVYCKAMKERPFIWCKTVWNGFDFAVDWRDEGSQIALNDKGMVTRDRTIKKDTFYWYKANWTTEPMVYITSRRFTPRMMCPKYVKVYSNCDSVELFVNGVSFGAKTSDDRIFMWEGSIHLDLGDNEITVVGTSGATQCSDTCIWQFEIENVFTVESVTASHYEPANPPENTIDGSLSTRWAGDAFPSIQFDLGRQRQVDTIGIAFYLGDRRTYYFDIESSSDAESWTPVLTGVSSSGTTADIEDFYLGGTIGARYFRIEGQGNTGPYTQWSSYYEVKFYRNEDIDCQMLRSLNCGYDADFSGPDGQPDCTVNMYDYNVIASDWKDDYRQTILPTDPGSEHLIAYWSMDGNYNDTAGGHDATAGSGVSFDDGHAGQAAYFDGTDNQSYLYCQNSTSMNLDSAATISAWIKSDVADDEWASVITKGVDAWRLIRNGTTDTISFHFDAADASEYQANGSANVFDGQWHSIVAVYDGSEVRLYIDGTLDASADAGIVNTTSDPVYIGSRVNNLSNRNWIGMIDEVRVYDVALNDGNILYLAGEQGYTRVPFDTKETDLLTDGVIDLDDLMIFAKWWLKTTE